MGGAAEAELGGERQTKEVTLDAPCSVGTIGYTDPTVELKSFQVSGKQFLMCCYLQLVVQRMSQCNMIRKIDDKHPSLCLCSQ